MLKSKKVITGVLAAVLLMAPGGVALADEAGSIHPDGTIGGQEHREFQESGKSFEATEAELKAAGVGALVSDDKSQILSKIDIANPVKKAFVTYAAEQTGAWYVWGAGAGTTANGVDTAPLAASDWDSSGDSAKYGDSAKVGFDCSSLVMAALNNSYLKNEGVKITADDLKPFLLERGGTEVKGGIENAKQGDVVFYNKGAGITHVAISMGNGHVIEAPASGGKVSMRESRTSQNLDTIIRLSDEKQ